RCEVVPLNSADTPDCSVCETARPPMPEAEPPRGCAKCGGTGEVLGSIESIFEACECASPTEAEPPRVGVCACGHGRESHIVNGKHPDVIPCWHLNADASYCGCQQ